MDQTNATESERGGNGNRNLVLLFIYKAPKKNHQAIVELNNRVIGTFKEFGVQGFEMFQLGDTQDMMGFTNIAKTISANGEEEEVWLEIQSYRDRQHLEEVGAKMMSDEKMKAEGQQFMNLITPGSRCSFGEFNRLADLGFT
jgi:uncharacterized protein YbaA (DUF1428 family)